MVGEVGPSLFCVLWKIGTNWPEIMFTTNFIYRGR
jgi:hypothetical protein